MNGGGGGFDGQSGCLMLGLTKEGGKITSVFMYIIHIFNFLWNLNPNSFP